MGQSGPSKVHDCSPSIHIVAGAGTIVLPRIIAYLQRRHPVWTAKRVSADTGIPAATITKWLNRGSAPSAGHMFSLGVAYRLDFMAAVFVEVDELEVVARAKRIADLEAETARLKAARS